MQDHAYATAEIPPMRHTGAAAPFTWALLVAALLGACAPWKTMPPPSDGWTDAPAPAKEGPAAPAVAPVTLDHCGTTEEGFDDWMVSFRRFAREQGISEATVARALADIPYDGEVIALDRSQKPFKLSYEDFSARRVTRARIARGRHIVAEHRQLLAAIVDRFGVPSEILVAVWGLETDYGKNMGSTPSLRALATLAYDCRRAAQFRGELLSALRILDRGDLTEDEMMGAWAGELGQTQFLPSSYERFGVDFDGDGHVDMVRSSADALASTARFLEAHGWRPHEPYGVGSENFTVLREWNASEVYRKTIVLFASKLRVR